jgi:hypothetical protein
MPFLLGWENGAYRGNIKKLSLSIEIRTKRRNHSRMLGKNTLLKRKRVSCKKKQLQFYKTTRSKK